MSNPILVTNSPRNDLIQAVTVLITQLPIQLPNAKIPINGVSMTTAQIVELLEKYLAALQLPDSLKGQWHTSIQALDQLAATMKGAGENIGMYVQLNFGSSSPQAIALGFPPRKVTVKTPAVKAEAAEKLRATRAARGTKGKRQRAGIHGEVPPTSPEPVTPAVQEAPKPNKP